MCAPSTRSIGIQCSLISPDFQSESDWSDSESSTSDDICTDEDYEVQSSDSEEEPPLPTPHGQLNK